VIRRGWLALGLVLSALFCTPALTQGSAQPLVIDSPAWRELMGLPLPADAPPPLYAADLIERWGRPDEAGLLRRAMLLHHFRAAAGLPRQAGSTVGGLWRLSEHLPADGPALVAAQGQAFTRSLSVGVLQQAPPGRSGSGLVPLPASPGFWLGAGAHTLGAHLSLRNTGPLTLAARELTLHLPDVGVPLELRCLPSGPPIALEPGATQPWWCELLAPSAATVQVLRAGNGPSLQARGARWSSTDLADDRGSRQVAEILAGRPPTELAALVRRLDSCHQQGTCPERVKAPVDPAELQARAEREAERAQRRAAKERRNRWVQTLGPWVYALVVITLHVLVARLVGRWAGIGLSLASGVALAAWLVVELRGSGSFAAIILPMVALGTGVVLAPIADWLYRRFFAGL
jgi:hypothetical protein